MLIRPLVVLSALVAALCLASPAAATTVLRLSPDQVESLAQRIIEGRCVEVRAATAPGTSLAATEYVFVVEHVLKGDGLAECVERDGGRLVVRQLNGVVGMPRYEVGQRYHLALNGDSAIGLTSPVGMGQGVTRLPEVATPPMSVTAPVSSTGAQP